MATIEEDKKALLFRILLKSYVHEVMKTLQEVGEASVQGKM